MRSQRHRYDYTLGERVEELTMWTVIALVAIPSLMFLVVMSPVFIGMWLAQELPGHVKRWRSRP